MKRMTLTGLFGKTAAASQATTGSVKTAAEDADDPGLIHRGLSVVLPEHIHSFVHDESQPAGARAHMLLAHVRKAKPEITSEEAKGTTGGLGNYWSPRKEKAAEYGDQGGWKAYHNHEREHGCGDPDDGYGGCPTTHVVLHAGTPPEKHHWTENFRDGERYDPEVSWRLPVRPDAKLMVHGISWKQGHDSEHSSGRDYAKEKAEPYSRYDFLRPMRKRAAHDTFAEPITRRASMGRPEWADDDFTARTGHTYHTVTEPKAVTMRTPEGSMAGYVTWGDDGVIGNMNVRDEHQRRGIATELLRRAREQRPDLQHSDRLSDNAQAWLKGIGERTAAYVPPGTMGTDSQGHGVQMTTMDGWAHRDGSHGHEDGPDVGEQPVYTQDHTWLPNGRYWGPNSAQNDQRLFEGDHLRPEVRQDILDRVGGVLGAYQGWEKWTRVYFAGSQAAKWLDQNGQGNGDFDILIGIDFDEFRDLNPQYEEMEDAEIASTLTEELWSRANEDDHWFTIHTND